MHLHKRDRRLTVFRTDGAIAFVSLLFALSGNWGWSNPKPDGVPLPESITIGAKTYAVVPRDSLPDEMKSAVPGAYRFRKGRPIEGLDESFRYWLEGSEFLRSPDGRFALPFDGSAPFVGYIDLAGAKFVQYKDAFPPTGEEAGKSGPTRYEWTALLDDGQKQPAELWLLVRRWNRDRQAFSSHRVRIPFDAPERLRAEAIKSVVERVCARREKEALCIVVDGADRNWARLSTDTWDVIAKGNPSREYGHIGRVAYSPDHGEIYVVYSSGGLVVFDAGDGREKASFGGVGRYANASTLGATFDPGGEVAAVSTPYASELTIIDVKSRRILSQYKTPTPLAGVVFDGKEMKAYTFKTFLPYE